AGTLWAGTKYGLVGIAPDRVIRRAIAPHETDNVFALLVDEGKLFAGHETAGLLEFDQSVLRAGGPPARRWGRAEGLAGDTVFALRRSGDALLVGTEGGLTSLERDRLTSIGTEQGFSESVVTSLAEDREGDLWLGTS